MQTLVLVSQNIPENSAGPVAPSYGQKNFGWVGNDKPGPQHMKWPPAPPRAPVPRAPGTHRTPSGVHWLHTQHAIKFGRRAFRPERPPRLGNPLFRCFWPVAGPGWPQNFSQSPRTPKPSKSRIAAAGGQTIESAKRTKVAQHEQGSGAPKKSPKLSGGTEVRPKQRPA